MKNNQFVLIARVKNFNVLRYTPAGIPVLELVLKHESKQKEMENLRQINLNIKSIIFGDFAIQFLKLIEQNLENLWQFQGFLATSRNRTKIIFHIQEIQEINLIDKQKINYGNI